MATERIHRRKADMTPDVLALRLDHIENAMDRLEKHLARIDAALVGTHERPGFVAMVAAHDEAIETHKRNFRLIAGTFVAQVVTLLGWSMTQLYTFVAHVPT